jgi:two-component system response regulator DesR
LLLAHSAPLLRSALRCLFEQHAAAVVAETGSVQESWGVAAHRPPDVVFAEAGLLDTRVRTKGRIPARVALIPAGEKSDLIAALAATGVGAFVSVLDEAAVVVDAVRSAARGGEVWVSPRVAASLLEGARVPSAVAGLSDRHRELLALVVAGAASSEIAARLHLAPGTVRNRLSALYSRIGVRSRAEALAWAWRNGVIPRPTD